MTDDKWKQGAEKTIGVAASGVVGATSALAAGAAGAGIALSAFLALFPPAVGLCVWAGFEWRRHRAATWWQSVVKSLPETTSQEVQGLLEAHNEEPWAREAVLESVRRLLEAVCDEVAPVLGSLTAEYLAEKRTPDSFFRGTARLVAELSREELGDFRQLILALHDSGYPADSSLVVEQLRVEERFVLRTRGPRDETWAEKETTSDDMRESESTCPDSFVRLCHLLKVNGLAWDAVSGFFGSRSGPGIMRVDMTTLARLSRHLR